jgi:hypothetical protein
MPIRLTLAAQGSAGKGHWTMLVRRQPTRADESDCARHIEGGPLAQYEAKQPVFTARPFANRRATKGV